MRLSYSVGETDQFAQIGGIINFTIIESRVPFEIDQAAARRAGLRISAKLLNLALVIRD